MEKILVIEDDRATRKALQQLFEPEGYSVDAAQNGVEGLALFRASRPNFVILDLAMPQMNGRDVCRQLRKESEDIPILVLTGSSDEVSRVTLLEMGADDYVTKPFSPRELLARVRAVLRRTRRAEAPAAVLAHRDLTMDEDAHEVRRGDRAVDLTPTEYHLLRYLLINAGRVVSKAQILDHVWRYDFNGDASVVETYVSYLRKKLDGPGQTPLIQTVRGFGYAIRLPRE